MHAETDGSEGEFGFGVAKVAEERGEKGGRF